MTASENTGRAPEVKRWRVKAIGKSGAPSRGLATAARRPDALIEAACLGLRSRLSAAEEGANADGAEA